MNISKRQSLDQILESAVVANWADLMRGAQTCLVQMEYAFSPSGTLDFVQIWSSFTRGHWLLACSYWMSASTFHGTGVYFDNGYESEGLAHILESAMHHQNSFVLPPNLGRKGLLQVSAPSETEIAAAAALLGAVFDGSGSALAQSTAGLKPAFTDRKIKPA
jgi:hypothetical protein